jgi:putative MATE family efflux protein
LSVVEDTSLLQRGPWRALFTLALPVMAEELANLLVGYTDWYLTGRFLPGDAPKAAMGLVAYALWLLPSLFSAAGIGAQAITARYVGAGNRRLASHATNQALLLGAIFAGLGTLLTWFFAGWFVRAMQLEANAALLAERYLRIMAPVVPLIMVEQIAAACLRGAGDTWTGFYVKAIVNLLNLFFSTVLAAGIGPFPRLGWEGIAIGTAIGHGVGGLLLLVALIWGRAGLKLSLRDLTPDRDMLRRILNIGLPGGVDQLALIACHLVYASIINRLGTEAAAAHGLGIQIEALSYLPGSAFMVAAATLAGQSLGARDPQAATAGIWRAWTGAVSVMTVAGTIFFFGGPWLTVFFNGGRTDEVTTLSAQLLKIVALGSPFHATLMVFTGGLRGAGDTRWPLIFTFIGLIGVRLPLAMFLAWPEVPLGFATLPAANWGVQGAWVAMVSEIIVRSMLVVTRFLQGGWRHVAV